jgi:hypothetical protein
MGKVHRIKKAFWKVVASEPWEALPPGRGNHYHLADRVTLHVGKRSDGSWYLGHYGQSYKALMRQLMRDFHAGVAHSDKAPTRE